MKIRMKKTEKGSEDGRFTKTYEEGREYDVPEKLAGIFFDLGVAEEVKAEKAPKAEKTEKSGK